MSGFVTGARLLFEAFDRLSIPYAVGGSVASSIRGIMRATMDVDIIADIRIRHADPFVTALRPEFYLDAELIHDCLQLRRSFNAIHTKSAYKFDIFVPSHDFEYSQINRAQPETSGIFGETLTCPVLTAEDVILAKLRWYRLGGETSERQWRDIAGVVAASSGLDMTYLRSWAPRLGVAALLERALS